MKISQRRSIESPKPVWWTLYLILPVVGMALAGGSRVIGSGSALRAYDFVVIVLGFAWMKVWLNANAAALALDAMEACRVHAEESASEVASQMEDDPAQAGLGLHVRHYRPAMAIEATSNATNGQVPHTQSYAEADAVGAGRE